MYNFAGIRFGVVDANIDSTESKQKKTVVFDFVGLIELDLQLNDIFPADLRKGRFTNSILPKVSQTRNCRSLQKYIYVFK